jgi:hypothetical protein
MNHTNDDSDKNDILILKTSRDTPMLFDILDKILGNTYPIHNPNPNPNQNHSIGAAMDFEFDMSHKTKRFTMSLCQIRFSHLTSTNNIQSSKTILYDLRLFDKKQKKQYIDRILLNKSIIKVLHGSESLDLPGLREFIDNDADFVQFLATMADTRFLCAAHNILWSKQNPHSVPKVKCTIYSALFDLNLLTKQEYDALTSIKINYNKPWIISKLSDKQIKYAAMDVLGLYNLYIGYVDKIGPKLHDLIMEVFRQSALERMGILPHDNMDTKKMLENLRASNVLDKQLIKSPMGSFTIRDMVSIDYLRKTAIRSAYKL